MEKLNPPTNNRSLLAKRLLNALTNGLPLHTEPNLQEGVECPPTRLPVPATRPIVPGLPLTSPDNQTLEDTRRLISTIQCIRRGRASPDSLLRSLEQLLGLMPPSEADKSLRGPLEAMITNPPLPEPTYENLLKALTRYINHPNMRELVELSRVIRASLLRPCQADPKVEEERSSLENRMQRLGLLLGVVFPLVFVAGFLFYRSVLVALVTAVAIMVVWTIVRHQGTRYAQANMEHAWSTCEQVLEYDGVGEQWAKRGLGRKTIRGRGSTQSGKRWWRPSTQ